MERGIRVRNVLKYPELCYVPANLMRGRQGSVCIALGFHASLKPLAFSCIIQTLSQGVRCEMRV